MKRFFLFIAVVFSALCVSCEQTNDSDYIVVITSETEIKLGKYGEDITISYDIKGIVDVEANVSLSDDSWLRIKEHKSGSLTLTVAENETGGSRMAAVKLSYNTSSANVIINQSAEAKTPVIESLSGNELELERMGKKVNIEYSLKNTNPDDYIYAKTSADWIYSINTMTNGIVELGVATNTTKAMRETTVTVGYGSASFDIVIKQRGDGDINLNSATL